MQVYNIKEQMGQKEIREVQLGRKKKRSLGSFNVIAKTCAGREVIFVEISAIKELPALCWNNKKGAERQDPIPLSF